MIHNTRGSVRCVGQSSTKMMDGGKMMHSFRYGINKRGTRFVEVENLLKNIMQITEF